MIGAGVRFATLGLHATVRFQFVFVQRSPQINGSQPRCFIRAFGDGKAAEALADLVHETVNQILCARFRGVLGEGDRWPELLDHCPRVLGGNEERIIAEQDVQTAFDLMMMDVARSVEQVRQTIDDHLVGVEEARE